ncbi:hypothetical protein [Streptomyces sp. Da 82-17]|uniref:hypothetical protein n=1 Tax=Streptomyces sp. Da 82-17 TaxID=3377116 RepID=UPI0038D41AF5
MQAADRKPTTAMWWAEIGVFLGVTALFAVLSSLVVSALFQDSPVIDGGGLIVAGAVGMYASRRFREWGLNRKSDD